MYPTQGLHRSFPADPQGIAIAVVVDWYKVPRSIECPGAPSLCAGKILKRELRASCAAA